jgi:hypothetical protein
MTFTDHLAEWRIVMDRPKTESPESDMTMRMLRTLADGTLAGLANYHLWELQLREIRELPVLSASG